MATDQVAFAKPSRFRASLDVWAVFAAFLLAGIVRAGIIKHVPW
jgi:hypothetical protein